MAWTIRLNDEIVSSPTYAAMEQLCRQLPWLRADTLFRTGAGPIQLRICPVAEVRRLLPRMREALSDLSGESNELLARLLLVFECADREGADLLID